METRGGSDVADIPRSDWSITADRDFDAKDHGICSFASVVAHAVHTGPPGVLLQPIDNIKYPIEYVMIKHLLHVR